MNIAAVGFGGMGANYIAGCAAENIVALCDVDEKLPGPLFAKYPGAGSTRISAACSIAPRTSTR